MSFAPLLTHILQKQNVTKCTAFVPRIFQHIHIAVFASVGAAFMPTFSSCCLCSLCGRGGGISIPSLFVAEYGIALFCREHSPDNFPCSVLRNDARGNFRARTVADFYLFWNFRKCILRADEFFFLVPSNICPRSEMVVLFSQKEIYYTSFVMLLDQ